MHLTYCLQYGKTPLHVAAWENHKDFAELLVINGADVNAKDNVSIDIIVVSDVGHFLHYGN